MNPLAQWEQELKTLCPMLPHWQQIELQGFWYGLVSWLLTCAEEGVNPTLHTITAKELLHHAATELETWPSEWLQGYADRFIALSLSYEDLNNWFTTLDTVFRDCISTDLDIFSILGEGVEITDAQWGRLYESMAFQPPDTSGFKNGGNKHKHKTRRIHGRRALTPMRRHHRLRAITQHQKHPLHIVKLK
jgi:hypothetical protein